MFLNKMNKKIYKVNEVMRCVCVCVKDDESDGIYVGQGC